MPDNTSTTQKVATPDLAKFAERVAILAFGVSKELWIGLRYNLIPWNLCLAGGTVCCLLFLAGKDRELFEWVYLGKLYPTRSRWLIGYWSILVTSSFWGWALCQWVRRQHRSRELERVFCEAGLKSVQGRIPKLVFEKENDEQTTILRVTVAGATLNRFKNAKDTLETNLKIYIDDMRESRKKGVIDIVYSSEEMPRTVKIKEIHRLPPCKFLIGETRASVVKADIRTVAHLLIAGQTGGGKSTFLRQFITTHYLNLPASHFVLIDLKEGLESHLFEGLSGIEVFDNVKDAVTRLKDYDRTLQTRLTTIKAADCVDLDQYLRKMGESSQLERHFIIVDEAAELFLAGGGTKSSEVQEGRRILSDVARRGRAAGVHLVVATQRPDTKSLDPQVKANLPGVLCFQMANDSSSITVLGVGRATELPPFKGRAIWKVGAQMIELQTPLLTDTEALALLEPRKQSSKANGNPSASRS